MNELIPSGPPNTLVVPADSIVIERGLAETLAALILNKETKSTPELTAWAQGIVGA